MIRHNTLCRKIEYLIINNFILFMGKVYVLTIEDVSESNMLVDTLDVYANYDKAKRHFNAIVKII